MASAEEITVRYSSTGHVRYQIPAALCELPVGERLVAALRRLEGVYRVDLYRKQRKLSIRFIESFCEFTDLHEAFLSWVERLAAEEAAPLASGGAPAVAGVVSGWRASLDSSRPVRWFRAKLQEGRETITAFRILLRRRPARAGPLEFFGETTVLALMTDAALLYLLKRYWHLLFRHWLLQPWRYRYEWLSVLVLTYPLFRFRRTLT
jgi:hypothetical protein